MSPDSNLTAFVIEDDAVIAQIFGVAVKEAGFEVEAIHDGVKAIKRLKETRPDLVLLDLHLPGISGIQVLDEIRNNPRLQGVRVLVISADATQTEFLRANADMVAIKPIGFHQLKSMVERLKPEKS
jgi:DNA-binding response OmpR family regulator